MASALVLGYDVIFSDLDIAILRDPINYMFLPGIDYMHSDNYGCNESFWSYNDTDSEGNTGFYSVRSTKETILTWEYSYKACILISKFYEDQYVFWQVVRKNPEITPVSIGKCPSPASHLAVPHEKQISYKKEGVFTFCGLDNCMFSSGDLRSNETKTRLYELTGLRKAHVVHANWLMGSKLKKEKLAESGLWLVNPPEHARHKPHNHSLGDRKRADFTCSTIESSLLN